MTHVLYGKLNPKSKSLSDADYLQFLESLENPDSDEGVVPIETYLEQLEAKERETKGIALDICNQAPLA